MLTTTLDMITDALYMSIYSYMVGNTNKYFMVTELLPATSSSYYISLLSHKNPGNSHVVLRIRWFTEIMEFSGLTNKTCGQWMGNRKLIWSGLIYVWLSIHYYRKVSMSSHYSLSYFTHCHADGWNIN